MRIRRAARTDARSLAMLRWSWRVGEEAGDPGEEREDFVARFATFATEALDDRWVVWIAEEGDAIVATIWIHRVPKVPTPGVATRDFGYVTNVYTVPAMRDRGVGSDLLAAVRDWAEEVDLELLLVWPSDRSVPWYARAGFVPSPEVFTLQIAGYEG